MSTDAKPSATAPAKRRRWLAVSAVLGFGLWWAGSLLVHALLFGVLYVAGPKEPNKRAAATDDDFHMTISPARVESVVADIRTQQKQEFEKKVAEMASIKAQLDALDATKIQQYNALMKEEAQHAPDVVRQAAQDVKENQQAALEAQKSAQAALANTAQENTQAVGAADDAARTQAQKDSSEAITEAKNAQNDANQAQKRAEAAQVKLKQQIEVFGENFAADATDMAKSAADAQSEAQRQQDTAIAARGALDQAQKKAAVQTADIERSRAATASATQHVADMEKKLAELQPPPAPAAPVPPETAPDAAAGSPAPDASPVAAATAAPPSTKAQLAAAAASAKRTQQEIDRLTKSLPGAREAATRATAHETDARGKLVAAQQEIAASTREVQIEEDAARARQQAALEKQATAQASIDAAMQKQGLTPMGAKANPEPPPAAASNANLADLYNQAQEMESAVADSYKNVRAAELAAIRKIPLAEAQALTEVAKPDRAAIDTKALTRDIRDVQGVRAQEKAIEAASGQMDSMVALAERMKDLAAPSQPANVSVEAMKTAAAQSEHMEQLATEDEGSRARDLTGAMAGGHESGNGLDPEAMAKAQEALQEAGARVAANPLDPKAALDYRNAMQALSALAAMLAANGTGNPDIPGAGFGIPYLDGRHVKAIPGRTITTSMVADPPDRETAWMFVDSWYLIGPWPNPGRKNLDTKFPPESVVDLDAQYTGGRQDSAPLPVRWKFYQASAMSKNPGLGETSGMITPPGLGEFEVYYAYTELWLDQPADLWVAVGSDDQSKVWLNDQMIWKSADYYKPWVANEGMRKVHFVQGINRVLYRLENGHSSGGFSLMVCVDPTAPPPVEAKHIR